MARILVVSDLHWEFGEQDIALPGRDDYDIAVLPGDISSCPLKSIEWAERTFDCPIVIVAGAREHFGRPRRQTIQMAKDRAARSDRVHFLEDEHVVVDGVRFVGSTLWTNFKLFGAELESYGRDVCELNGLEFQYIWGDRRGKTPFTTGHAQAIHFESLAYIRDTLLRPFAGPSVVVTHHAPHKRSLTGWASGDFSITSVASDLERDILELRPEAWIHGCVHRSNDYMIGDTRIFCNAKGHIDVDLPAGINREFDAGRFLAL